MNPLLRTSVRAAGVALLLALASCGDSSDTVAADGSSSSENPINLPADDAPATDNPDDETDETMDQGLPGDVIGAANINGEVISGEAHAIDNIAVLESAPEQLAVTFTAGAEPCLAADAVATASDTEVVVTLMVGINDQAAFTTCEAGDFEHTITISLDQPLDGRSVTAG